MNVVDVVVRWRGDVVAIERLDGGARGSRAVHVGPVRLDTAQLALPCTLTRGAFVISIRADDAFARATAHREIDPVLVRAAGVPLVLMAGLFAALVVTAPRTDDTVFASWLARRSSGYGGVVPAPKGHTTLRFARPTPTPTPRDEAPDAQRAPANDNLLFRVNGSDAHADLEDLMSAVGEISAATSPSSSELFAQMSDATRNALMNGGARSGGNIAMSGDMGIALGLAVGPGRARIEAGDDVTSLFGAGALGTDLAADIRAIDTSTLRSHAPPIAAAAEPRDFVIPGWCWDGCPELGLRVRKASEAETIDGASDGDAGNGAAADASDSAATTTTAASCALAPAVKAAMRSRMPALRVCGLRFPDDAIGSRLVLRWSVAKDGSFVDVRAGGVEPAALAACLEDALSGARIDEGCADREVTVTYPLLFDGAG